MTTFDAPLASCQHDNIDLSACTQVIRCAGLEVGKEEADSPKNESGKSHKRAAEKSAANIKPAVKMGRAIQLETARTNDQTSAVFGPVCSAGKRKSSLNSPLSERKFFHMCLMFPLPLEGSL